LSVSLGTPCMHEVYRSNVYILAQYTMGSRQHNIKCRMKCFSRKHDIQYIKVTHRIEGMAKQKLLKRIEKRYMSNVNVFHGADNPILISS
jgi:uncharacterized pyridoxamine 5'-phosphate oxidase family protein